MRSNVTLFALAVIMSTSVSAQQQQRQTPLGDDVLIVSPDAKCPDGMTRQVYTAQPQRAEQGFGWTQHYCVAEGSVAEKQAQQGELVERSAWPVRVSLADFGTKGTNSEITPIKLEAGELELLRAQIGKFRFANYRLSGCHDRAHAAFLMLPEALQEKAFKVWVVSPSVFTRGVRGSITYPADASVDWGYHVALAFSTDEGFRLFDPTLSPGRLLTEDEWLGSFRYPALSMRLYSPGKAYQFYNEDDDVSQLNDAKSYIANKDIWTGAFYEYSGLSKEQNWIPTNLARDEIGTLVEEGQACDGLQEFKGKPGELLDALQARSVAGCQSEFTLYDQAKQSWIGKLQ